MNKEWKKSVDLNSDSKVIIVKYAQWKITDQHATEVTWNLIPAL